MPPRWHRSVEQAVQIVGLPLLAAGRRLELRRHARVGKVLGVRLVAEQLIRDALRRLMQGRTVIAIAHRLSSVRSFDRILVLERGRVVQDGTPEALLRSDGLYSRLMEAERRRLAQVRAA